MAKVKAGASRTGASTRRTAQLTPYTIHHHSYRVHKDLHVQKISELRVAED